MLKLCELPKVSSRKLDRSACVTMYRVQLVGRTTRTIFTFCAELVEVWVVVKQKPSMLGLWKKCLVHEISRILYRSDGIQGGLPPVGSNILLQHDDLATRFRLLLHWDEATRR